MHQVLVASTARKALKKLPKDVRKRIIEETKNISKAPYQFEKLQGVLHTCRSYHFTFKGIHYRIAYTIDEGAKSATVVLVGTRESFYKKLERIFR